MALETTACVHGNSMHHYHLSASVMHANIIFNASVFYGLQGISGTLFKGALLRILRQISCCLSREIIVISVAC